MILAGSLALAMKGNAVLYKSSEGPQAPCDMKGWLKLSLVFCTHTAGFQQANS